MHTCEPTVAHHIHLRITVRSKDHNGCKDLKGLVLAKCLTNISSFLFASPPFSLQILFPLSLLASSYFSFGSSGSLLFDSFLL